MSLEECSRRIERLERCLQFAAMLLMVRTGAPEIFDGTDEEFSTAALSFANEMERTRKDVIKEHASPTAD